MCGIFAISQPCTCASHFDAAKASSMSLRQKHRGPDYSGFFQHPVHGSLLGHERLAIMDLACIQPIPGSLPDHQVVHNGEIYNHQKLRDTVLSEVAFRTTCDSEVLIYLYEKFAPDFDKLCNLLDGVFAFAIICGQEFFAARDPIGVKQMYYGTDGDGRYFFSSEFKTFEEVCGSHQIHSFPIGHYFTPSTGFVRYFNPRWFDADRAISRPDSLDPLRDALIAATHKRLMSDAHVGVLLSGGLDSSLISAIACRQMKREGKKIKSFSIGLDEHAPDLIAARQIADFLGTEHHEVHFTVEDGIGLLRKLVWHLESYDVTTIRSSTPMYFLSRKVRDEDVKVVLSGEGADEIFGGYLYFHNAPSDEAFVEETIRRVNLLNLSDCLRADKSCMANSVEVRVPFLDKAFLEVAMGLAADVRRPNDQAQGKKKMEKYVLRKAFDSETDPFIPSEILWRQKEQFSDGVGYGWIDELTAYCESQITDEEMENAATKFPYNTPSTKEAYFIRKIFHEHFPSESSARTVTKWEPRWQKSLDPSGRASLVHHKTHQVVNESE